MKVKKKLTNSKRERLEIRIHDTPKHIYNEVKKRSETNYRPMGREALAMLTSYLAISTLEELKGKVKNG